MSQEYPEIIEFAPTFRDRLAGTMGSLLLEPEGVHDYAGTPVAHPSLHEMLDDFEAQGKPVVFDAGSTAAHALLKQLHHSPQFEQPLFISGGIRESNNTIVKIGATSEKPVHLPVRNFVYANSLQDWNQGRAGYKSGSGGSGPSRSAIREYASKRTPMPPIGFVSAHVQPDGRVLYSSLTDGAHRVAAAHLRGDKTIAVGNDIIVRRLGRNIIGPNYK